MDRREHRLLTFLDMNGEWRHRSSPEFEKQLNQFLATGVVSDAVEIFDLSGKRIYPLYSNAPQISWPGAICTSPCYGEISVDHHRMRTLNHIVTLNAQRVRICLAGNVDEHDDILSNILNCYLILFPLLLIASITGGFIISGRALEPVDRITRDARTIGICDLSRRLPVPDTGDELQRLTETLNALFARLESAVNKLTQFTSDISHDLRTSTSVMMATAQVALRRQRTSDSYRTALHTIALECQAMEELLKDLLTLARTEEVKPDIEKAPVNLAEVLDEMCDQMRGRALLKEQLLLRDGTSEAWVFGNLSMLRRLVAILLDNAVKYTPEKGMITTSVAVSGDEVHLEVMDTGIGIAPEHTDRIFDRFFRTDPARGREDGRKGLGLAIARWIADMHGATIRVASTPGQGSQFTVSLPRMSYIMESTTQSISA
jgi:two-component system heavy metal sensor histidine kinase CusS